MAEEKQEIQNNAKCSYCGNDTFCDSCLKAPDKDAEHMCFECYQQMGGQMPADKKVHLCIPPEKMAELFQRYLDNNVGQAFEELWNAEKKKLKEMSKQEIAQACFFEGARFMYAFMQNMSAEQKPEGAEAGGQAKEQPKKKE